MKTLNVKRRGYSGLIFQITAVLWVPARHNSCPERTDHFPPPPGTKVLKVLGGYGEGRVVVTKSHKRNRRELQLL